jgi:4-hydroxy-tetrahydrodipicolinate synthase
MTVDERTELYKLSVSIASRTGTPVAAGVAATTVAAAVTLAKAAVAAGCEGIMLGLPPYCKLCDEEIRTYVMAVKSVVDSSFPILLYDNVLRNGYGPSLPLLAELCGDGVIWGVKLAVAPEDFLPQARKLLELCPSIRLYTGSDKMAGDLLNYTKQASQPASAFPRFYGLTSIIGNVYPDAVGSMVSNLTSDNAESVELGEAQHLQLVSVLDAVLLGVSLPAGLKHAMRHKGLSAGYTRQPVGHVGAAKAAEIEAALERYEGK